MVMECISGRMVIDMRESGSLVCAMAMGLTSLPMATLMWASTGMGSQKDMGSTSGPMATSTKGCFIMGSNMAKANGRSSPKNSVKGPGVTITMENTRKTKKMDGELLNGKVETST
jgi:hypothetical protein